MDILTYNIHSCIGTDNVYSVDRVANVIQKANSDIVCLQEVEVNDAFLKNRIWSQYHRDDQVALIANKAKFKYHVFVPAIRSRAESNWKERHQDVSDNDVILSGSIDNVPEVTKEKKHLQDMGKFGIAILSKFPIMQIKTYYYKRYKKKTRRNAMACLIALPDERKQVWVVNTHLGCHFIGKEQYEQSEQLSMFIHSLLEKRSEVCGVITCGDFNSPPWYSCIRRLKTRHGLRDAWDQSAATLSIGGTFPSHEQVISKFGCCIRKLLRLDYIFLCGHIQCKVVYVYDDCLTALASDHLPLCAVFQFV